MKRLLILFVLFTILAGATFGQGMPTLYKKSNLTNAVVATSDTSSAAGKKSLKFTISTNQNVSQRSAQWNLQLVSPQDFPVGAMLYLNSMIPVGRSDVNVGISFLKDTTVVLNAFVPSVSSGGWRRQAFQFPAVAITGITAIRITLSYPQGADMTTRVLFVDAVIRTLNGTETIWNDCSGDGGIVGAPVITSPVNGATVSGLMPVIWVGAPIQAQFMDMNGGMVKDTNATVSPCNVRLPNGQYQLRAKFIGGTQWSSTIVFTVSNNPTGAPTINSPVNNSTVTNPFSVVLAGLNSQIKSQFMDMNGVMIKDTTVNALSFQMRLPAGQYQMRVQYVGAVQWSPTTVFTVNVVTMQVPVISNPVNNSTGNPVATVVRYSGNTPEYEITIAKDYGFTQGVLNYLTANPTNHTLVDLLPSTTYYLKMRGKSGSSYTNYTAVINFMTTGVTGVDDKEIPTEFTLSQNYPNPFNPTTKINFAIKISGTVKFTVRDMLGREISEVGFERDFSAGNHSINLNFSNMASGVYFYTLAVGKEKLCKKMVLTK